MASMASVTTLVRKVQIRWTAHLSRMPDDCFSIQLIYGELHQGKHPVGKPRKRFKDSQKLSFYRTRITPLSWEEIAADHTTCCNLVHGVHRVHEVHGVHGGSQAAEDARLTADEMKHRMRKNRA